MESTEDERRSRLASAAGRLAFYPARAAVRASRDQLDDVLLPEIARLIDHALASPLPENVMQSAVRHRVIERVAAELVASGALDKAVQEALESAHTTRLTDRIVHSDQMRNAIREVVESPEVRVALTRQTTGLAEELVGEVRARAVALDDRLERIVRRRARPAPSQFAGLATRAVALAVDAALILLIFASLAAVFALVSSLVGTLRPAWVMGVILGSGWAIVAAVYLVLFWTGAGQTPGMRLLRLRVLGREGRPPSLGRSILRAIGTAIAIIPLFAGFLPVLFEDRRRGLPDFLAGTVVVYEDPAPALAADPIDVHGEAVEGVREGAAGDGH
jgi:uncharacterized RDD family membrane protein YckC